MAAAKLDLRAAVLRVELAAWAIEENRREMERFERAHDALNAGRAFGNGEAAEIAMRKAMREYLDALAIFGPRRR